MTNSISTKTALLRYVIKYAGIEKEPQMSLYGFTDKDTNKCWYTLYFESMTENDRDKIKNILQEGFGINRDFIKRDDWITSYLFDIDTYMNLVTILKVNGLLI